MAGKTRRPGLVISAGERERLERLRYSRKSLKREVERAAMLLRYAAGEGVAAIQQALGLRPAHHLQMHRQGAGGRGGSGTERPYHRPKEPLITQQWKAWVLNIACTKPTELGLAAELWTLSALARYTRYQPARGACEPCQGGQGHNLAYPVRW